MLRKFTWKSVASTTPPLEVVTTSLRDDLQIRNLLDDPRLRRSMGLEVLPYGVPAEPLPAPVRPAVPFNRRRLLGEAAA
ncbi:MAG: hypothetical protein QNJ12_20290 [Ilumatobacter sp.]|uniref:hypothetical protein n=1 Tax=Ilumatobacter sp. TaxID=1967498 RepID=UPI002603D3A8|nr:hypothetical protein [Ilumatobacter sp.]MDJ0771139.1 hypothetical protein [Ilumatobacter sp.]